MLAWVTPGGGTDLDVIVHYHGHRTRDAISDARSRKLIEQLQQSGRKALLLAPAGPINASDSAGGKHDERDGLKRFIGEAFATGMRDTLLPPHSKPKRVILSGFSGGYKVIASALERGGIEVHEVWLHDALYGNIDTFKRWAQQPGHRLVSTHTPGGGTRAKNEGLAASLRAAGVNVARDLSNGDARVVIMAVPEGHQAVTGRFGAIARGGQGNGGGNLQSR